MERWSGKVAIVTGASGGIGSEIVEALVRAGVKVVGAARRIETIQNLAVKLKGQKGILHPISCDLRKEDDILKVFKWTDKELGGVDILVNAAGVSIPEPIIDGTTENYRKIMDINVIAIAICIREAVRSMRKRNVPGHIININSVAGHNAEIITIPVNLYPASKYAVTALSQSVINELTTAKMNIKVTCISPGGVKTEILIGIGIASDFVANAPLLTGKDIADAMIYALGTAPNVQVKELTVAPLSPLSALFGAKKLRNQ